MNNENEELQNEETNVNQPVDETLQTTQNENTASENNISDSNEINIQQEENKVETTPESGIKPDKKDKKKKKKIIIIVAIILLLIIAGVCYYFFFIKETKTTTKKIQVNDKYKMTGNDIQNFDLKFLQLEDKQQNIVYSPLSIKYALAMLADGSKGDSKTQITNVIGNYTSKKYTNSQNLSLANAMFINNAYKDKIKEEYTNNLKTKYNAEVQTDDFANAANVNNWVSNKTLKLVNNVIDDNSINQLTFLLVNALAIDMDWNYKIQAFGAESGVPQKVYSINFKHENYSDFVEPISEGNFDKIDFNEGKQKASSPKIGATINNYDIFKELGEDKIRTEVEKEYREWLQDDENQSYIKSELENNNEDLKTEESIKKFMDNYMEELGSNYKQVAESTDFSLYKDENITSFAKDLKTYDGTTLQYVGIMPNKVSLKEYVKDLNAKKINNVIKNLKEIKSEDFEYGKVYKITGHIPLFKTDYELKLKEDLTTMGIKNVFDKNKSDLSNMIKDSKGDYIEKAIHKANIEFSNDGIKAGAVTMFGGWGSASAGFDKIYEVPVEEIDITFDKPYIYIIRDKSTGEVWFAGQVYNPEQ